MAVDYHRISAALPAALDGYDGAHPEWWKSGYFTRRNPDTSGGWVMSALMSHVLREASGPVLDVACGMGTWLAMLSQCGFHDLSGVDVDAPKIDVARALHASLDVESTLLAGDLLSPLKRARGLGLITCIDALYDIAKDPREFLETSAAMLAGGGFVAFDWYESEDGTKPRRSYLAPDDVHAMAPACLAPFLTMRRDFNGRRINLFVWRRT